MEIANGVNVPGWLIVNSASATSEAVLGLSAYVKAAPGDQAAATALARYADGINRLASGGIGKWPFGAILPEENSPTFWHAWGGMEPAALSTAASVLNRADYQRTAAIDTAQFTAQLLATGGPDNGWTPTPADQTQIAYGVDSRVEGLIAVADATHASGLYQLAGSQAAWYFGANPAGVPVYDPATGVCVDGINSDKTINHNCGAESSIHTELSMLALDAHPDVARIATSLNRTTATDGLTVVEAESGTLTGSATIVTPPSAWTGSANWSGGKYVQANAGDTVTLTLPQLPGAHRILPIADLGNPSGTGSTSWTASAGSRSTSLGASSNSTHAPQGIAPTTVYLQPQTLPGTAPAGTTTLTARIGGAVSLDAVMLQPVISHLGQTGPSTSRDIYINGTDARAWQKLSATGPVTVQRFDRFGQAVGGPSVVGSHANITVEAGGFTVVSPR
jgi:flagellin-like hook-associated protein FlgL